MYIQLVTNRIIEHLEKGVVYLGNNPRIKMPDFLKTL